ncbi:hypothetical protein Trco_000765 [Trichoderma cornu-damae]|uniref:Uncharacterized protein n=1 Tax=Trichoderma cornu-damae TaxID=654480 RepID=A0A9P8QQX9_9HYPO|nr:hypothetical protein Trco_000765 [Trichoderma cornu-damae]
MVLLRGNEVSEREQTAPSRAAQRPPSSSNLSRPNKGQKGSPTSLEAQAGLGTPIIRAPTKRARLGCGEATPGTLQPCYDRDSQQRQAWWCRRTKSRQWTANFPTRQHQRCHRGWFATVENPCFGSRVCQTRNLMARSQVGAVLATKFPHSGLASSHLTRLFLQS